jgi:O-antigen/teichoic acid export membrane protein
MVDAEGSLVKRASSSFIWNQGAKIVEFGLAFAFNIIVARMLGPEKQGIYATVTSLGGLVFLFASLGFEDLLNKYIAKYSNRQNLYSGLFLHVLKIRGVIIGIFSIVLFIYSDFVANVILGHPEISFYIRLYIPLIFISSLSNVLRSLFFGLLKVKYISIASIINNILNIAGVYFVLKMGYGISGLIIYTLITFVISIVYLVFKSKGFIKHPVRPEKMKPLYLFGLVTWLTSGLNFALGKQMDVLLLNIFRISSESVGYYHVGVGFAVTLSTISLAGLFGIDVSIFSHAFRDGGYELTRKWWGFITKVSIFMGTPILLFFAFFGHDAIIIFFSNEYEYSIVLFQIFIIVCWIGKFLGINANISSLYAIGKERAILWIRISSTLLNILLAILLIPVYKIWGALLATSIATIFHIILELVVAQIIIKVKYPFLFAFKILLSTIICGGLVYFIINSSFGLNFSIYDKSSSLKGFVILRDTINNIKNSIPLIIKPKIL